MVGKRKLVVFHAEWYHDAMEQKSLKNRKAGIRTLLCVGVLAVFFLFLTLRVPYGYDWTDEQYFSEVAYRLLQGDRPLVDTWEVHQFSSMISAPILGVYRLANNGSMDGSILFMRYVYITIQFAVSLAAFGILRKRHGDLPACIAAAMILSFTHFSINSFYYDTMALLFTIVSALFVIRFLEHGRFERLFAFFSGVSFALAILAFPYFLFGAFVYLVFWLMRIRSKEHAKQNRIGALLFLSGGALIAAAAAIYILSGASVAQVLNGLHFMMADPDHQSESLFTILKQYFNTIRVVFSPVSYGAAFYLVLGVTYHFFTRAVLRRVLKTIGAALLLLLMFGGLAVAWFYWWNGIYRINLLAMTFAMCAPGLYFFTERREENGTLLMYFLACALSIAVQIGSNTRLYASSGMLLPASVATILFLFEHRGELAVEHGDDAPERPRFERKILRFSAILTAACFLCVAGIMALRLQSVHRDEPIRSLNTVLESGAAKGIYTTEKSAALHRQLIADIRENAPAEGSILITYLFPEGYLVTGLRAATPSTFNMCMGSAWLEEYYAQNPERIASYVYATSIDIPFNAPAENGIGLYQENPEYQMKKTDTGTVFIRTDRTVGD